MLKVSQKLMAAVQVTRADVGLLESHRTQRHLLLERILLTKRKQDHIRTPNTGQRGWRQIPHENREATPSLIRWVILKSYLGYVLPYNSFIMIPVVPPKARVLLWLT